MPQLVGACKDSKNISFMKKFLEKFWDFKNKSYLCSPNADVVKW